MRKKVRGQMPKKARREFKILGGTALLACSVLIISIFLASSLDVLLIRSQQYAAVVAAVLVDMANQDRGENRLDGLTINPVLTRAAQMKADDMAAKSYCAHTSPEGVTPWHWFQKAGYAYTYAGENLAIDFSDSDAVNAAWMNSPAHRANILDQHFTEVGIATRQGSYEGHATTFVVQEFGTPAGSKEAQSATRPVAQMPTNPAEPAIASASVPQVLGVAKTPPAQTSPAKPSAIERVAASPQRFSHYAYYALAALVLLALIIATGFEFHVRHIRKAAGAAFLFALMLVLFIAADRLVFVQPGVPSDASMTAASAAAFPR